MNQQYGQYSVRPGPEAFLPPAAASMGVVLPDPGQAHINGRIVPEEEAFEEAARMFLGGTVPTIFPGPLVLWAWNEKAKKKAKAIKHLYDTLKERSEEHTSELQSLAYLVCRLLLEKKKNEAD